VEEEIKMNLKFQSYSIVKRRPTDGREVEMSTSATHIVWRYIGDVAWIDLVELSTFKGAAGDDGNDGREVELSVVYNHLVWRYIGDETWIDLFEVPIDGPPGAPGDDGREVEMRQNAGWLEWRYVGDIGWTQLYEIPGVATDNAVKVAIDFVDAAALTFVYNCPVALVFTSQDSEAADATISPVLNTNMSQYGKVTVTAPGIGLIVLNGTTL
jgi:hypothetical protein